MGRETLASVTSKNQQGLTAAKKARQDEFYSQWVDVEREMNAYLEYNPDVFRGKTLLLPCDDPEWSNFTKYFALHFADFGLAKLISTSYAPRSNAGAAFYSPTLFETEDPAYDEHMSMERGRVFTLTPEDVSGDGRIDIDDLKWEYLEEDGDFRSAEVTALRDEADVVLTNPPFSLFRTFLAWLIEGQVQFSIRLFEVNRASRGRWLTPAGVGGCRPSVCGGGGCRGCGSRRRCVLGAWPVGCSPRSERCCSRW